MSKPIGKKVATGTGWVAHGVRDGAAGAWSSLVQPANPIVCVGSNAAASTYAATLALAKIPNAAAGDVAYTTIVTKAGKTVTAPTDWVLVTSRAAGAVITFIYRKILTGSEPASYTWTVATANAAWIVHQLVFRGLDQTTPDAAPKTAGGYVITGFGAGPFVQTAAQSAFLMAAGVDLATSATVKGDPTMTLERFSRSSTMALASFYEVVSDSAPISRGCMILPVVQGAACAVMLNGA